MSDVKWKLVPVEPTEAMIEAHFEAHAKAKTVFADVPEIWSAMLAASPTSPPAEALPSQTSGAEAITARYTNWQGVTAERTFIPHRVFFGSNEWHPEPQVLIEATDCEKGALRAFAAAGFSPTLAFTYSSTQATKCACCGEHKHTPLRRDEMGGYVCLTCIDKRLDALAKPAGDGVRKTGAEMIAHHRFALHADNNTAEIDSGGLAEEIDKALAAPSSPASSSPAEAEALQDGVDESRVTTAMIDAAFKVCPLGAASELGTGSMQRMIAAALSSAPAQEDGSQNMRGHPRGSGQNAGKGSA